MEFKKCFICGKIIKWKSNHFNRTHLNSLSQYAKALKGGLNQMDKPIRMEKRLTRTGNSDAVILPKFWVRDNCERVVLEIEDHRIIITPIREKKGI